MVRVTILTGDNFDPVGEFEFDQLARNGDSVTIPWPADDEGCRIFDVDDVIHIAAGAPSDWGPGPRTILRTSELT
jgi:hypothetical protein